MELHIYGRNLEIDDTVREHVESKLDLIDRHLPGITNVTVELAFEATRSHNDRIVAQVTLHVGRTLLRAQQRAATTKSAVSSVAKTLDRQIERFKGHAYRSERSRLAGRGGVGDEAPGEIANNGATGSTEVFAGGQVVRLKEFDMELTSVEQAAAQMQFLGHDFYMFLDSESDKLSVIYLRGDGNYGLIQPK